MIYLLLLGLLCVYAYKVIEQAYCEQEEEIIVNNSYKSHSNSFNTFSLPKIDFIKGYKRIISFFQLVKSFEILKKLNKFNNVMLISIAVHFIGLFILTLIKTDNKPIIRNWQVQLELTDQEIEQAEIRESAPPLEEEAPSAEGGNENEVTEYTKDIPMPQISYEVISNSNQEYKPPFHISKKTHLAKISFNKFVAGNSSGKGDGYGFGNGNGRGFGGEGNGKSIFGDKIIAKKIGVILDVSGSMQPYISILKEEINSNFKDAKYEEVNGCGIRESSPTICAMEDLSNQGVDTIYWFCDLQDYRNQIGMQKMKTILASRGIRLYVKSLDCPPDETLRQIINNTKGNFLAGKFKTFSKL